MAKRKAKSSVDFEPGIKKVKKQFTTVEKKNLLDDSDSEDDSIGGVLLGDPGFRINQEFANRFEHNKKREELAKLEEKFTKPEKPSNGKLYGDKYDEDSESSDEDEDDEGFLATEDLDAEISATLQAIRSKDPRVYDEKVTFYKPIAEGEETATDVKKEKPMYLHDYHRENLLNGVAGPEEEETQALRTFAQEQEDIQRSIIDEMHAAVDNSGSEDEDGGFLIPKAKPQIKSQDSLSSAPSFHPSRAKVNLDIESAEKDPETFLSNFLQARAWVPNDGSHFQALESDDDEELERAEKWEADYNLRFENTAGQNENLKSYARDIIAAKSVRREEPNSRKKQRDVQREKKEAERAARDMERARLRQLKIEEMEEKLQKIKKAAGIRGKTLKDQEWIKFLDNDWDNNVWEAEMNKKFGQDYYAEPEAGSESEAELSGKKKKVRKPKWDDDIDIKDLIPDFVEDDEATPAFTLSDDDGQDDDDVDMEDAETPRKKSKTSKDHAREKSEKKRAARIERKKIEDLVDNQLDIDLPHASKATAFRYRDTSPTSFGLTAQDILMAPDTSLNQFAGLKKMAAFRDSEKKRKDKKNLGKKARLRQWRKDTFGNEDGPEVVIKDGGLAESTGEVVDGKKKKKRNRKNKTKSAETEI